VIVTIFAADEGGGFCIVQDLFVLRVEGLSAADAGGDVAAMGERGAGFLCLEWVTNRQRHAKRGKDQRNGSLSAPLRNFN